MSAPQTTPRTTNMTGNIPSCFAPLNDCGDRTNQLHWLKLLHASYIFLSSQAGKGRVFYSVDKPFKTGADPRNIFDKQKFGHHVCRHFTVWSHARLWRGVWMLAPLQYFWNQRAREQKTIGSHLKKQFFPILRHVQKDHTVQTINNMPSFFMKTTDKYTFLSDKICIMCLLLSKCIIICMGYLLSFLCMYYSVLFTVQNTDPNCPWLTNWVEVRRTSSFKLLCMYNATY